MISATNTHTKYGDYYTPRLWNRIQDFVRYPDDKQLFHDSIKKTQDWWFMTMITTGTLW